MFGEALSNLADCLLLLKQRRLPVEPRWLSALSEGIAFLRSPGCLTKEGIYPLFFDTDGHPADGMIAAGGVACVTAILAAAEVTGDRAALKDGLRLLRRYDALFTRTLDALSAGPPWTPPARTRRRASTTSWPPAAPSG
ncbi:MAG: hypothetical protein IT210_07255 [Armatimonadetes bacterium]|nr:hypothetical protein [Armatimonadota bacterium]